MPEAKMKEIKNVVSRGSEWSKWDLHIHTNASDGNGSCDQILKEAKAKNIRCIAVTDHHTFANVDVAVRMVWIQF